MIRLIFLFILALSPLASAQGINGEALLRGMQRGYGQDPQHFRDPLSFTQGNEDRIDEDGMFFEPDTSPLAPSHSLRPQVRPDDLVPEDPDVIAPMCGCSSSRCRMTSEYGPRWGRMHGGDDYGAPTGTPLYAQCDGVITQRGYQSGYGNVVEVACEINGDTIKYKMAHMNKASPFRVGQRVSQGEMVGQIGSTGRSTGPHLHIEVRKNGTRINPTPHFASHGIDRRFPSGNCPMSVLRHNPGVTSNPSNNRRAVN